MSVRSATRMPVIGLASARLAAWPAVAASRTPWRLFRIRSASVASDALSTIPTRGSSLSR